MTNDYIIDKAAAVLKNYGQNPFDAAATLGAYVSFKDLGSLKGAYFGTMPKPTIVINELLDEQTQKTVCAHELGHFVLHKESNFSCESITSDCLTNIGILEREANIFAAAYLIDISTAKKLLTAGHTTFETASILETDVNLLLFLFSTLGLCDAPNSEFLK